MTVKPKAGYLDALRAHRRIAVTIVLGVGLAVGGCGGDSEDSTSTTTSTTGGNQAPTMSGSPALQAVQGQTYSFSPSATDPNGDALTFSIAQRNPVGASYDVYPAAGPSTAKVVKVAWNCSRTIYGRKANTENVQTERIVISRQG